MRPIDLLAAVGAADEQLLKRSEKRSDKRSHWASIAVAAAAACLCFGIIAMFQPFLSWGTGSYSVTSSIGADQGTQETTSDGSPVYDVYAGPVLPLTLREANDSIQASRNITYDLTDLTEDRRATVTDTYTLTNTSGQEQTVSLLYPVKSSCEAMLEGYRPKVQVDDQDAEYTPLDGAGIEPRLHNIAALPNDGLFHSLSWEAYVALLSDGSYLAEALGEIDRLTLDLSTPVYVYQLSDLTPVDTTLNEGETLEWAVKCTGWTIGVGFHGMSDGWSFANGTQDLWFTSIGQKLTDLEYKGHNYERGLVDITATVTIHESTLEQELRSLLPSSVRAGGYLSADQVFSALKKDLEDLHEQTGDYFYNGVGQAIGSTLTQERIFYLSLEVTIPAGQSRTVAFTQTKAGSYNINYGECGTVKDGYGYDMMTFLGSNLHLTDTQAALQGYEGLEILDQNFGFDLSAGKTTVDLDLTVPHYYLTVQPPEEPQ